MGEGCLYIRLLGTFEIGCEGKPLAVPPSRVARLLLAYLILHAPRVFTRSSLVGTFWPERSESASRRALSQALWQIRHALGPASNRLVADWETVAFCLQPEDRIDVKEFEAQEEDPASAILLYRADLLEGLFLDLSGEDWLLPERERLREKFLGYLEQLIVQCKLDGDYQQALKFALQLVSADPLRESAHRETMRLYFTLDRAELAIRHYETCCQVLREQLDASPEIETQELAAEIARLTPQGSLPHVPKPLKLPPLLSSRQFSSVQMPLFGRAEERKDLLAFIEEVFDGHGGVVLIEGEAGVGKTRLVQEVARDVEWRGGQVLLGSTRQLEISPPYGPLVDALSSGCSTLRLNQLFQVTDRIWLQVLKPFLPELAARAPDLPAAPPLPPDQEQPRLREAFVQLLIAWTKFTPLVLVLEDLQWADQSTLDLLCMFANRLQEYGVIVVGTLRSEEVRSFPVLWEKIQDIDQAGLRGRLSLKPLSGHATGELIRHSLGMRQLAPLFEERIYKETEGNPLFVLETLRSLYDEGKLTYDTSGVWSTPWDESTVDYAELPVPAQVEQVIARRLSFLMPTHRMVLNLAAVLGSEFDFSWLLASSGMEVSTLLDALKELRARHFLLETPQAYRFSHEKIRFVAYQALQEEERVLLHRQAARALENEHPEHAELLAHHFYLGRVWDKAARHALEHGKRAAAQFLAEAALNALAQADQIIETQQPFSPLENLRLSFEIWEASFPLFKLQGRVSECQRAVEKMLALSQALDTVEHRLRAWLHEATYRSECVSEDEGSCQAAQKIIEQAHEQQLPIYEAQGWLRLGIVRKEQSRNQDAEAAFHHALDLIQQGTAHHPMVSDILLRLVYVYRDLGDIPKAEAMASQAIEHTRSQDDALNQALVHNALAWIARSKGAHHAEAQHCQAMFEAMHAIGYLYYEGVALNNLSLAHSVLGDFEQAIHAAERALEIFGRLNNRRGQTILLLNLSSRYKETGRFAQAQSALEKGLLIAQEMNFADEQARMHLSFAELLTWRGEYDLAQEHLARAAQIAQQLDYPYLHGNVAYRQGQLYLAKQDFQHALHSFQRSEQAYREAGWQNFVFEMQSYTAICHLHLGQLALALRASQEAVAQPEEISMVVSFHHFQVLIASGQTQAAMAFLSKAWNQLQGRLETAQGESFRRALLEEVPLHTAIRAAWQAYAPRHIIVRLPRIGAPSGRPLHEDEYVEVTWTPQLPQDDQEKDKVASRQARLLRLLQEAEDQGAAPTIDDLARALEVSRATVKRDLSALRRAGHRAKTRGGK